MNKYVIVQKSTEEIVQSGFTSRQAARNAKRVLEQKMQKETGSQNRPSAYYVETGSEHPDGSGIYLH